MRETVRSCPVLQILLLKFLCIFCALSAAKGMVITMKKVLLLLANGFETFEAEYNYILEFIDCNGSGVHILREIAL